MKFSFLKKQSCFYFNTQDMHFVQQTDGKHNQNRLMRDIINFMGNLEMQNPRRKDYFCPNYTFIKSLISIHIFFMTKIIQLTTPEVFITFCTKTFIFELVSRERAREEANLSCITSDISMLFGDRIALLDTMTCSGIV